VTTARTTQSIHPMSGEVSVTETMVAIFSPWSRATDSVKERLSTGTKVPTFNSLRVLINDSPRANTSGPVVWVTPVGQYHGWNIDS